MSLGGGRMGDNKQQNRNNIKGAMTDKGKKRQAPMEAFQGSAIHSAISNNNVTALHGSLTASSDQGGLLNDRGESYLHLAIKHRCSEEVLELLLSCSTLNLAQRNVDGHTALDVSMQTPIYLPGAQAISAHVNKLFMDGEANEVRKLVVEGWDAWPVQGVPLLHSFPEAATYMRGSPKIEADAIEVHKLVHGGKVKQVKAVLTDQTKSRVCDGIGMVAIHKAVLFGYVNLAQYILTDFPDTINMQDSMGRTALHYAAALKDSKAYNLLVQSNADTTTMDKKGKRASYYLKNKSEIDLKKLQELVEMLIRIPDIKRKMIKIHQGIKHNVEEEVTSVLDSKMYLPLMDATGLAPIHKVAIYRPKSYSMKRIVLESFGKTAGLVKDRWGRVMAHYALAQKGCCFTITKEEMEIEDMFGHKPGYYKEHPEAIKLDDVKETADAFVEATHFQIAVTVMNDNLAAGKLSKELKDEDVFEDIEDSKITSLLTAKDASGLAAIHRALLYGRFHTLKEFMGDSPISDVNVADHMGRSALHYAAALDKDLYTAILSELKDGQDNDPCYDVMGYTAEDYLDNPQLLGADAIKRRLEGKQSLLITASIAKEKSSDTNHAPSQTLNDYKDKAGMKKVSEARPDPNAFRDVSYPSRPDAAYCARMVGPALARAMREIAEKRPHDPIEYLSQYLRRYAVEVKRQEEEAAVLELAREAARRGEQERTQRQEMRAEQRALQLEIRRLREEEMEEARKEVELEERKRMARVELPSLREEDEVVSGRDKDGRTRLHLCAGTPGIELREMLEMRDATELCARDAEGNTPRQLAEKLNIEENVQAIDKHVEKLLSQGNLNKLIHQGYYHQMAHLIRPHDDLTDDLKFTQEATEDLFRACQEGSIEDATILLNSDETLATARNNKGQSPLHVAVLNAHMDLVALLLQTDSDLTNLRDNWQRTPLHYAMAASPEMGDLLQQHGSDPTLNDLKGKAPDYYLGRRNEIQN